MAASRLFTIHLLCIIPKDRVYTFLLNTELCQRLFYKFIPISDGRLGVGLGGG